MDFSLPLKFMLGLENFGSDVPRNHHSHNRNHEQGQIQYGGGGGGHDFQTAIFPVANNSVRNFSHGKNNMGGIIKYETDLGGKVFQILLKRFVS